MISNAHLISARRQLGIGLIELMISMLIGLFIMAGVVQMFSTSAQNSVANAGASRVQEHIRYVFSRIAEDISQSGNLGCISAPLNGRYDDSGSPPIINMLRTTGSDAYAFLSIVNGDNDAENITDVADGTDTFRIRYVNHAIRYDVAGVTDNNVTVRDYTAATQLLRSNQIVAVTNCSEGAIFMITNTPGDNGVVEHAISPATDPFGNEIAENGIDAKGVLFNDGTGNVNVSSPFYLYAGSTGSYEYSVGAAVGAAGACALTPGENSGPRYCSLYRSDSGDRQELVQGVHNIQVNYGWTDAAGNLRFTDSPSAAQLPFVDRMRVTINFNSIDDAIVDGNNLSGLIEKTVSRTFNLYNQL